MGVYICTISLGNSLLLSNADVPIYTQHSKYVSVKYIYIVQKQKNSKLLKCIRICIHTKITHNINEEKELSLPGFELICNTDKEIFKIIP